VPRILIADDDLSQLGLRKLLLETAGHQVRAALSVADALRQTAQGWADLLILDLRMPDAEHGLGLIRGIRESGCAKPILVLSGWPDDLYGQPEERMVTSVIVKTAGTAALLDAISGILS
jgi:DNA-binding response OmpR family regulator